MIHKLGVYFLFGKCTCAAVIYNFPDQTIGSYFSVLTLIYIFFFFTNKFQTEYSIPPVSCFTCTCYNLSIGETLCTNIPGTRSTCNCLWHVLGTLPHSKAEGNNYNV